MRIASETGTIAAPPTACRQRKAISQWIEGESAQPSDAAVKTISPSTKTSLWPKRSARRPKGMKRIVSTRL